MERELDGTATASARGDEDDSRLGHLVASGWLPDWLLRLGIRCILADGLAEAHAFSHDRSRPEALAAARLPGAHSCLKWRAA